MKQSINRNILWTELFVSALENLGIKHACISPGSRNTPLTIAFHNSKRIKSFIHVDERSSGFFALGLANKTKNPVVLVTTSGTATIELYPAIVEAFQQRIPLIVCTADRPNYLYNTGANQTINQVDVYKNHILRSFTLELPSTTAQSIISLYRVTKTAVQDSAQKLGPVHINFPFDFPFEPSKTTDQIDVIRLKEIKNRFRNIFIQTRGRKQNQSNIRFLMQQVMSSRRRLILVGPGNFTNNEVKDIFQFAKSTKSIIFADGLSGMRFKKTDSRNLLANHASFLGSKKIRDLLDPDLIIQIGAAPTSNPVLEFYKNSASYKISINKFGDLKDPSRTTNRIITGNFVEIFKAIRIQLSKSSEVEADRTWLEKLIEINTITEEIKNNSLNDIEFPFEGRIINEILKVVPQNSNIMISNSLPVRDLDTFASKIEKEVNIFSNRGASGIDGITSTAAGIVSAKSDPTFLITGDLAFYHDLTGLLSLKKHSLPLIIFLLNNDGGGIFELLPIAKEEIDFENYFKTPLSIDFENIVSGFKGHYSLVKSWSEFDGEIRKSIKRKTFLVIEVQINSKTTLQIRKKIWSEIKSSIDQYLNEN